MKVLILSAGDDTGGVGIALAKAINRHTAWEARECHRTQNYIQYPTDILWAPDTPMPEELRELFRDADVIHVMERWSAIEPFEDWRRKPTVMHHHGQLFRDDHLAQNRTARVYGARVLVSTLDLTLLDPQATWLPNPCDVEKMQAIRALADGPVRMRPLIGHSPTRRDWKGTDEFIAATREFDVELIERTPWAECLRRKARCDVFFDQLYIGYALAGIEAMAMGIPLVSGAVDPRLRRLGITNDLVSLLTSTFGYLPFLLADETNLRRRITEMASDADLRRYFAALGLSHVRRWHDEAVVARQLVGIYEEMLDSGT